MSQKTVRVRIAVAVKADKDAFGGAVWGARGECGHSDEDVVEGLKPDPTETIVWVEADIPIPSVVIGTVIS